MTELRFARGLSLPTDAVTQKFAFLGRTGSGKSYGAKRLVESLLALRAQVVILDPVGVWHGLRVGEKVSFDIPVIGGLHGDLPLTPTSGEAVARICCARSISMVLDVSQMHDAERTRFAEAFAREFFQLKKAEPSPVMLVLEEMQEFAPQNPNPGEQMMLHEFQRIAKLGRNFGIGMLGISQRPQECSKKVLNQTECVVAFQMTGPQERKALEYWLSDRGIESKDLGKLLPTLEVGKPLLWSPQWLKRREVIEILPIDTSDTSQTPKFGAVASPFEMRSIDIAALRHELDATIEEAAKDDPKALRARILQLELLVAQGAGPVSAVPFERGALSGMAEAMRRNHGHHLNIVKRGLPFIENIELAVAELKRNIEQTTEALNLDNFADAVDRLANKMADEPVATGARPRVERAQKNEPHVPRVNNRNPSTGIPSGELAVLSAIARKRGGALRAYVVLVTGLRKASVETYVQKLVTRGLVRRGDGMKLFATPEGFGVLPEQLKLPSGEALVKHYTDTLPGGEGKVFGVVASEHPRLLKRESVVTRTGLSSASVETYVQKLVTRGLLQRHPEKKVSLHPEFGL